MLVRLRGKMGPWDPEEEPKEDEAVLWRTKSKRRRHEMLKSLGHGGGKATISHDCFQSHMDDSRYYDGKIPYNACTRAGQGQAGT
jgi:hypothetical protein